AAWLCRPHYCESLRSVRCRGTGGSGRRRAGLQSPRHHGKTSHAEVEIPALLQMRTWETVTPRLRPSHASGGDRQPHTHDGHEHIEPHTCGVSTLTLRMDVPLDLNRLKLWLLFIVKRRSHELMRFKGILRCQNQAAAVIVQGVYQWVELRQGHEAAPA